MVETQSKISMFCNEVQQQIIRAKCEKRKIEDLNAFPVTSKQCLYVLDWQEKKCVFQKGVQNFLGFNKDEYHFDFALNNYHPDDIYLIQRIIKAAVNYCIAHNVADNDFSLILTYRVRKKNGEYIKVLRQSSMFDTDAEGKMISNFSLLTDISFLDESDKISWTIHANNLNDKQFKENIYQEFRNFFTKRETQIIKHINDGFTNNEIATHLFISEHTVATHRKNIYRKCKCNNKDELLAFAYKHGIIF